MPYGQSDPAALRILEEVATAHRLAELGRAPLPGGFDYDHFKAIHRDLFQDVYEWAGRERTAPAGRFMSKDGHNYYGAGPHLSAAAEAQFAYLRTHDFLRDLPRDEFVTQLAEVWGELNVVHPFREGTTRTQFVFFSQLADHAGWHLDPAQFAPDRGLQEAFIEARFHSQDTGSNRALAAVLDQGLTTTTAHFGLREETPHPLPRNYPDA